MALSLSAQWSVATSAKLSSDCTEYSSQFTKSLSFGNKKLQYDSCNSFPLRSSTQKPRLKSSLVKATEAGASTAVTQEVEVQFEWKGAGSEVLLSGDFFSWIDRVPLVKVSDGYYQIKQKVRVGTHEFKFIVDGVWMHSSLYETVHDGAGGFNNIVEVKDEPAAPAPAPAPAPEASKPVEKSETKPTTPAAKPPVAKAKKPVAKKLEPAMLEDVIPKLTENLSKEKGLLDLTLIFADNQLRGSFMKDNVPYAFWCFFPDGTLEGARGFSLATHGGSPSTIEPFIIDEKKITPELIVFWVTKRLFAQKLLSLN